MGGTGGGEGGRQQTKNREMEKKDAGREQEKVKRRSREDGAGRIGLGEAVWGGACMEPLASAAERSRGASRGRGRAQRSGQAAPRRALRDRPARPSKMKIS